VRKFAYRLSPFTYARLIGPKKPLAGTPLRAATTSLSAAMSINRLRVSCVEARQTEGASDIGGNSFCWSGSAVLHLLLVEDNPADVLMVRQGLRTSAIPVDVMIAYDDSVDQRRDDASH
jgi:hypothetical protein